MVANAGLYDGMSAFRARDYATAYQLLLPVAQQGDDQAQGLVATLLYQGRGIAYDLDAARYWFRRAEATRSGFKGDIDTGDAFAGAGSSGGLPGYDKCRHPAPVMPRAAIDHHTSGVVWARLLMDHGVVRDVAIIDGPKVFHESVRQALFNYACSAQFPSMQAHQEFNFQADAISPVYRIAVLGERRPTNKPAFDSDWSGLSPSQKMAVRRQYPGMSAEDEPPYPTQGMGELQESIRLEAEQRQVEGILRLDAKIGTDGAVLSVAALNTADPALVQAAELVIRRASFKPGRCAQKACVMNLPIDLIVSRVLPGSQTADEVQFGQYRDAAQAGDVRAQNALGTCYRYGIGVTKDLEQAVQWYQKAADQGNTDAQMNLASVYAKGIGVAKDPKLAMQWMRKAAEQGDFRAQADLGEALMHGLVLDKDQAQVVSWLQKSAAQGYAAAQNNLADSYEKGNGVASDLAHAVKWYRLAADQRAPVAIFSLSQMYADGRGVAQDAAKAVSMLKESADLGYPHAQFDLAQRYAQGNGVDKDADKAAKWFRLAAKGGYKDAVAKLKELGLES